MLPKTERLTQSALIQKTYAGKRISQPLFTVYALPRRAGVASGLPRAAFVAGKKVHLKAVRRNLVKRRMREAYRQIRKDLPGLRQWYSVLFVSRDKMVSAGWSEIKSSLQKAIISLSSTKGQA